VSAGVKRGKAQHASNASSELTWENEKIREKKGLEGCHAFVEDVGGCLGGEIAKRERWGGGGKEKGAEL